MKKEELKKEELRKEEAEKEVEDKEVKKEDKKEEKKKNEVEEKETDSAQNKGNNKLLILIGVAAILICVAIGGIVALVKYKKPGVPSEGAKYVTLGDYKATTVDVTYYTYTDEELRTFTEQDLDYYVDNYDLYDYATTDKEVVSENDIANIDYVGTKDGVAFDGGTADGYHLEIGSHTFIDGFEDGLIGVKVGDTVDLNLTFPEEYQSEELAGQAVVFSVLVNSIDEKKAPTYNAEFFSKLGLTDVKDFDGYVEFSRGMLDEQIAQENALILENAIWETVVSDCEISEVPAERLKAKTDMMDQMVEEQAATYGIDKDTMLGYMGYDGVAYAEFRDNAATIQIKKEMVCEAIGEAEGIKLTDEDLKAAAEDSYMDYGFSTAEEMLSSKPDETKQIALEKKVYDIISASVTVNELEKKSYLEGYINGEY